MQYSGVFSKMQTELTDTVQYYLVFENDFLHVNQLLDKDVTINLKGYQCMCCKKEVKLYRQGFCYDCFYKSPQAGDWIFRPELSTAHLGIEDRDLEFEKRTQLQPHVVYLSLSSEVKVGVTRKAQIPTRWIDQGAVGALPIVEVPNRYLAGITEVALKEYYPDKTNWRKMLTNTIDETDLKSEVEKIEPLLPEEVKPYFSETFCQPITINYPVLEYPQKITSINLDKTPDFKGKLKGIKGQYLIFEGGKVLNVRNNEGYKVEIEV
ncbi:MAG: DUF2797 domain-containing protein [Flavobacteriales bacterium]|nr:DUF2797 domain-containing protein [Flavobacteriales bacterium]